MPSTSKKQHNFMAAIAHNPAFAKKVGVSQSVGKDFNQADKGKKFGGGGMATKKMHSEKGEMKSDLAQDKKMIKKAVGMHDKQQHGGKKTSLATLKKGGLAAGHKSANGVAKKGLTKGKEIKMNRGGKAC
jgi:hypothetical protein